MMFHSQDGDTAELRGAIFIFSIQVLLLLPSLAEWLRLISDHPAYHSGNHQNLFVIFARQS
jgi:hypothetical protein